MPGDYRHAMPATATKTSTMIRKSSGYNSEVDFPVSSKKVRYNFVYYIP